jgi:hypothetical protein
VRAVNCKQKQRNRFAKPTAVIRAAKLCCSTIHPYKGAKNSPADAIVFNCPMSMVEAPTRRRKNVVTGS